MTTDEAKTLKVGDRVVWKRTQYRSFPQSSDAHGTIVAVCGGAVIIRWASAIKSREVGTCSVFGFEDLEYVEREEAS